MNDPHGYLERMNLANDPRFNPPEQKFVLYEVDEKGRATETSLPTHWEVCPMCHGEGKHVNPNIDAGGLTAEDFAEDPEFMEEYMSGTYDIPCNACKGRCTVKAVSMEQLSEKTRKAYEKQLQEEAHYRSIERAEFIAGA